MLHSIKNTEMDKIIFNKDLIAPFPINFGYFITKGAKIAPTLVKGR
jgi:hypothetical protein